jgi:hypothetical protein
MKFALTRKVVPPSIAKALSPKIKNRLTRPFDAPLGYKPTKTQELSDVQKMVEIGQAVCDPSTPLVAISPLNDADAAATLMQVVAKAAEHRLASKNPSAPIYILVPPKKFTSTAYNHVPKKFVDLLKSRHPELNCQLITTDLQNNPLVKEIKNGKVNIIVPDHPAFAPRQEDRVIEFLKTFLENRDLDAGLKIIDHHRNAGNPNAQEQGLDDLISKQPSPSFLPHQLVLKRTF